VPTAADVVTPTDADGLAEALTEPPDRGVIGRGLGRSYGDAAQNSGGRVVDVTAVDQPMELDPTAGTVTVSAGVGLDRLMRELVPRGWFVPVTPGTRQVTVGGAIAADIHGKNHHVDGSWCDHVDAFTIHRPLDGRTVLTPQTEAEDFWAAAGGMGLTGTIEQATVRLCPIETSRLLVDTDRTDDLDATLDLLASGDEHYRYSVAWLDTLARGGRLGRAVLTRGDTAPVDSLDETDRRDPLRYDPGGVMPALPWAPTGLVNRWTIRAFNEAWYRKAPRRRRDEVQTIGAFFHPLDIAEEWNRLYGRPGFLQWQTVIPFGAEDLLRHILERMSDAGLPSFLSVLKRFGAGTPGPLSFPAPGWTLALDLPASGATLGPLLDELDREVAAAGGRVYLAKDSRLDPDLVPVMYPRLDEWRAHQHRIDPDGVLRSDLARRLRLVT
jgi:decaprenylphospho-beta-D-ribofuranose 2-oxidase